MRSAAIATIAAIGACSTPAVTVPFDDAAAPRQDAAQRDAAVRDASAPDVAPIDDAPPAADVAPLPEMDLVGLVDPFIGTAASHAPNAVAGGKGGSVFPGAAVPFGMVQWSPDTPHGAPSGYNHDDAVITGFSLAHLSGAGCPNEDDLPFLPASSGGQTSVAISHAHEHASAGAYDVTLDDGVHVELTATARTGFARFTYPPSGGAFLTIDGTHDATLSGIAATMTRVGDDALTGSTQGGNFCGHGNHYPIYFAIHFDQPFHTASVAAGRAAVTFDIAARTIQARVGVSYVSVANAEANLAAESPGWNFDAVRRAAAAAWNTRLNAIQASGGTADERTRFYTALYHVLLFPTVASDTNGQYLGYDEAVHTVSAGHTQYATYSNWDIYRSWIQLVAVLFPADASDMLQSLVTDAQQCGAFPKWGQANTETDEMVGDPGAIVVASGRAFGATGFDAAGALAVMQHVGATPGVGCSARATMPGLGPYLALGYIPDVGSGEWGPASTTLEYASRDFAVARFAQALGDDVTSRAYQARSATWQTEFDTNNLLIEARTAAGPWSTPLAGPGDRLGHYVEGNAEQYVWMVPYDPRTLFDALGGNAAVVPRLDAFFARLNAGTADPNFYMGNEPNFATPWLYDWAGAPSHTQDVVRRIVETVFTTGPDGLPGNDDLGATSSWLVWAMLGLYPEVPGVGGVAVASPVFPSASVQLGGRGVLRIDAHGTPSRFVQSASLDGAPLARAWIDWSTLAHGATLSFQLGDHASTWGSAATEAPPSFGPGTFASVADAYSARAIGPDGVASGADFDGEHAAYSATALAAAGATPGATITHGPARFAWPAAGALDSMVAVGQTVRFAAPMHGSALAFLGAANHGPSRGTGHLLYADGSAADFTLALSDWTLSGGTDTPLAGTEVALQMPYRNRSDGRADAVTTHVFYASTPIDPTKSLAAVTLPTHANAGRLHVFSIAVMP